MYESSLGARDACKVKDKNEINARFYRLNYLACKLDMQFISFRCHSGFGPPADLDPRSISASGLDPLGPNPLADMDPPFADLDPPTKLSF